jgi:hypothetical protein
MGKTPGSASRPPAVAGHGATGPSTSRAPLGDMSTVARSLANRRVAWTTWSTRGRTCTIHVGRGGEPHNFRGRGAIVGAVTQLSHEFDSDVSRLDEIDERKD